LSSLIGQLDFKSSLSKQHSPSLSSFSISDSL